ncbi:MAG: ATP-binding cassette domain-containing protein [Bdellovibrio sp.]|nr:MAG: ATP-binding cassette domain-containing protein [Bdellovibrio sp.]
MLPQNSHLITVTGGKGGVGKSLFAANLAFSLAQELKAKVLLIDADSKSCGDQNIITGIKPIKTIGDIVKSTEMISPQSLKRILAPHPSGVHFLGAVHNPHQRLTSSGSAFKKQLSLIGQYFPFIVADIGTDLTDLQYALIELSSILLMVTTPEVLVVNQTRHQIQELMTATVPSDLIYLVMNKVNNASLSPQSIAQNLRRPLLGLIPQDDITALNSVKQSTPFVLTNANTPIANAYKEISRKLSSGLLQKLKSAVHKKGNLQLKQKTESPSTKSISSPSTSSEETDALTQLKLQIHSALIKEMDLKKDLTKTKGDPEKEKELRSKTLAVISQLTDRLGQHLSREERSAVIKQVLDEALGLGPLEELLADPKVSEIMVNGAKKIYVERDGRLTLSKITFTSNTQLRNVIERIVTPLGRRIDEKTPYCDARLKDGSRVNAVIEPLALDGPALTIRKFPEERITIEDYVKRFKSMTQPMADFLRICVEQGLNIIISGGTGTGKTTLLNVLSGFIPATERIITVEDAAELQLKQEHVVRLETRPANMEGEGEVTIRDLIRNSLRMRPDRIVVGECRDGAALDMLSAMNTGHDGSMTTVHANTPREAVSRLETLCLMAGMDLPVRAIREQIAGAVNLIIQISRLSDGSRKVTSITEVVGMQGETVTLQEIFRFKETGFDKNRKVIGQFQAMGRIPTFIEKFEKRGVHIPRNLFTSSGQENTSSSSSQTSPDKVSSKLSSPKIQKKLVRPKLKKISGEGKGG